jgi:flavin reductase (DIM6/NTAB) family NADH-FMN oxidoreductase RutF
MITFDNVAKRYPNGREALAGVTFTIQPGEFVFLTGRSGAGKSSVLKLIALLERPSRGTVTVAGQNTNTIKSGKIPAFRRALGQFATGVTVVTTSADDQLVGMVVNSFSAVSLDPPLVLWSIRKESKSGPSFLENGHFGISILAEDQMEVSAVFGRPQPDQFSQVGWTAGGRGAPLMVGAIAHLECVNEAVLDGGDHHILVGRVERFARFEGAPLLFAQGQYGVAESHPALTDAPSLPAAPSRDPSEDMLFVSLLKATDQHMSALFQEYRHEVGVTVATGRVLNRLSVGSCTQETLEQDTFLGENAVETALSDLERIGQVSRAGETWALTEPGRRVQADLRRSAAQFTAQQLQGIPDKDVAAAERVLGALLSRGDRKP